MTEIKGFDQQWRREAMAVGAHLDRAHGAVHILAASLDPVPGRWARHRFRVARRRIGAVTDEIEAMRTAQPPPGRLDMADAMGSVLAINCSETATVALAVLIDAMAILSVTDDGPETEVLVGVCIDAEQAFEESATMVNAAARARGREMGDLKKAFDTDGRIALRARVRRNRRAIVALADRVGATRLSGDVA